jgi:putative membrane protein
LLRKTNEQEAFLTKAWFGMLGAALAVTGCATNDTMPAADVQTAAPGPMAAPMLSDAARNFAMMSASGNLFEIQSSQLALQASQNQIVRQFAQQMITDHGNMMQRMAPVAASLGLDPNAMPLAPHHQQMIDQLRAAGSGPAFDQAYHQAQAAAHQESLNLHQSYAANGDNPQLRMLAGEAVPVIQQHLGHLQMHGQHMMTAPQPTQRRAGERG